jgi:hypothetical protein
MTLLEMVAWVSCFGVGAYFGSKYELARLIKASESGQLLDNGGRSFRIQEVHKPGETH